MAEAVGYANRAFLSQAVPSSPDTLWCGRCRVEKPKSEFWRQSRKKSGYQGYCKPCSREASDPDYKADRHLKSKYGISKEQYDALLEAQGGACAICRQVPDRPLFVDHCHASGLVRGLLCRPCNLGIGFANDDPARLRAAADYLEMS